MEITFLGTGTSQGVPMIAHSNEGCDLANPKNWRTRCSIHVVMDGYHYQVDASPEFRLQCLRNQIEQIDYFILTHRHSDHIMGMDDLRRFCDLRDFSSLPVIVLLMGYSAFETFILMPLGTNQSEKAIRLLSLKRLSKTGKHRVARYGIHCLSMVMSLRWA